MFYRNFLPGGTRTGTTGWHGTLKSTSSCTWYLFFPDYAFSKTPKSGLRLTAGEKNVVQGEEGRVETWRCNQECLACNHRTANQVRQIACTHRVSSIYHYPVLKCARQNGSPVRSNQDVTKQQPKRTPSFFDQTRRTQSFRGTAEVATAFNQVLERQAKQAMTDIPTSNSILNGDGDATRHGETPRRLQKKECLQRDLGSGIFSRLEGQIGCIVRGLKKKHLHYQSMKNGVFGESRFCWHTSR